MTDTEKSQIEVGSGNVFADLDLEDAEELRILKPSVFFYVELMLVYSFSLNYGNIFV